MVGTNEEYAHMGRSDQNRDGLSQMDLDIIGEAVRLEIPFVDQYAMRRIADLLRGYAETLDFWSRRHDLPPRSVLVHLRAEAKIINARIRELTGTKRRRGGNIRTAGKQGGHEA